MYLQYGSRKVFYHSFVSVEFGEDEYRPPGKPVETWEFLLIKTTTGDLTVIAQDGQNVQEMEALLLDRMRTNTPCTELM